MNKKNCVYILSFTLVLVLLILILPVKAARYEGEIVKVRPEEKLFVLLEENGRLITCRLAKSAQLFYNNEPATLQMYKPVTADDFVSGYVTTDESGLVKTANFFYLVREGTIEVLKNNSLTLRETESGVCDSYTFNQKTKVYLNNNPSQLSRVTSGTRALVVLDYRYKVRKLAVFHYDYTGFVEGLDLKTGTVTINVGTRLKPDRLKLHIGGKVGGVCEDWEHLALLLEKKSLLMARFSVGDDQCITYMNIRAL